MQNTAETGSDAPIDMTPLLDDPYAAYAALRDAGPVHRITGADGQPAWLVTRYDDVRRAFADPRLSLDKRHAAPGGYRGFALPPALDANLLNMDPPDHTRVRRLVAKAFTTGRVEALRTPVRRTADELLSAMAERGQADLIGDYAGPLSIAVICDLLGIPHRDRPDFLAWSDALITPDPSRPELMKEAIGAMLTFYTGLIGAKRAEPGDDLLSDLIAVRDEAASGEESDRLTEDELTSLAFLILFAGYESTAHLIGNAALALLDHPDQLRQLARNPAELPAAVEEFLRFDNPYPVAIRRFPRRTWRSAAYGSRPGTACCCRSLPRTATRSASLTRTPWTAAGTSPGTSGWGTASITASPPRWPGWRPSPRSTRSSAASRSCDWPSRVVICGIVGRCGRVA